MKNAQVSFCGKWTHGSSDKERALENNLVIGSKHPAEIKGLMLQRVMMNSVTVTHQAPQEELSVRYPQKHGAQLHDIQPAVPGRGRYDAQVEKLDYHHYLPIFFDGLREKEDPFRSANPGKDGFFRNCEVNWAATISYIRSEVHGL